MSSPLQPVMLMYIGRRGAMVRFAREAAAALARSPELQGCVVLSRQSEEFDAGGDPRLQVVGMDTFAHSRGALTALPNLLRLRRALRAEIERRAIAVVIDLMPHVWSPALVGSIHRAGARYAAIAHDATSHPGDPSGLASRWADRAMLRADRVLVLSEETGRKLRETVPGLDGRIESLFHPDLTYTTKARRAWSRERPLRLLFLGRILPYKGLPLFVEAAQRLRAAGRSIEIGVFGEGSLGSCRDTLASFGATVVNRWLSEGEIGEALDGFDVVVVSHVEASQSGVVAAAHGAGMPVVATPVGALASQVADGQTGLVAGAVTGSALADAIERFWTDPTLYKRLFDGIRAQRNSRSMEAFLSAAIPAALA